MLSVEKISGLFSVSSRNTNYDKSATKVTMACSTCNPNFVINANFFLHRLAGCPEDKLPRSLEDALILENSCAQGHRYTESVEPAFTLPERIDELLKSYGTYWVEYNVLECKTVDKLVKFFTQAASWPLTSSRQAAIFIALQVVTGMGDCNIRRNNPIFEQRTQIIKQVINGCLLGKISLDLINQEPYHPPLMQIRDTVIGTRKMIIVVIGTWLRSKPEFYFPLCCGVLELAIKDSVGEIALHAIQILIEILPLFTEFNGYFIVDLFFMSKIKEDLVNRVLLFPLENQISIIAREAILEFVTSRNAYGISSPMMDEWKQIAQNITLN